MIVKLLITPQSSWLHVHLKESHQDVRDPRQQAQVRPQLHHDVRAEGGSFKKLV